MHHPNVMSRKVNRDAPTSPWLMIEPIMTKKTILGSEPSVEAMMYGLYFAPAAPNNKLIASIENGVSLAQNMPENSCCL